MAPEVEVTAPPQDPAAAPVAPPDPVTVAMVWVKRELQRAAVMDGRTAEADLIDQVRLLEEIKAVAAATQTARIAEFARVRVESELASGTPASRVGAGIPAEVGLACRTSAWVGARRVALARCLRQMPRLEEAFREGRVAEDTARRVETETSHLDPDQRAAVDASIVGHLDGGSSGEETVAAARKATYRVDPAGAVSRGRKAREDRRVGLRPKPDTMAGLSAFLPVEQGVACLAALRAAADRVCGVGGETRTRDQVMADTLVERITGQASAGDVNVEVALLVPVQTLLDPNSPDPADLAGHGPVPAQVVRDLIATTRGRVWWRRLFTAPGTGPGTGPIVGGDPDRRRFDGWLGRLIRLRDQTCRDPFCGAPIRHLDHIHRFSDGGETTLGNGRGVCERGNYVRELPGWRVETIHNGLDGRPHTVRVTTPTGHQYDSRAPDPP